MSAARPRRSPSRVAAAALVLGVAGSGGLGAAAWAAVAPGTASPLGPTVVTFTTPAASGQSLTQRPVVLNGDVSRPGGFVDSISVTVAWTDQVANRVPGPHPTESFTDNPDVREADVPWDVSPGVAFNGHYTVTVVGTTDGGNGTPQEQTSAAEPFIVDVSPATPANVVVTTDAGQRITHLKWTPNTEPDLLGYDIIRGGPTTPNRVIATVAAPQASYTDDQVATQPAGTYRYWVVAVRQSGTGNGVDQSAPSNEVDATFTTPPKSVSPPPPTTAAPANGSSGPGSASSGTTPSGAGAPGTSAPSSNIVLPPVEGTLPAYQALLNQAQNTTVTTAPPDPGFGSQLPYKPQITRRAITLPPPDTTGALGAVDTPANTGRQTTEYIAAALLLAVLAMFALVLKRSADQAAMLESLAPDSGGLLALGGLGAGRAEIPEDPADAPSEDGWTEGTREEGVELAPVEVAPAAGAAAGLATVDVAPVAAVPAAEVARPRRGGGPLMAFEDLLAQTARDPADPDGARAHRRLKWSERAARLAVALATEHDAPGEEAVGDDGRPQDEAVQETADGAGRSFIRGRRRRPEPAAPSEVTGAEQPAPVVPPERVPEPLALGRRLRPGPPVPQGRETVVDEEALPSRLLLVLRDGAGAEGDDGSRGAAARPTVGAELAPPPEPAPA